MTLQTSILYKTNGQLKEENRYKEEENLNLASQI